MLKRVAYLGVFFFLGILVYGFVFRDHGFFAPEAAFETIVYESEVDGPADCTQYENYDATRGVCFFECENESACEVIQKTIDDELNGWVAEEARDASNKEERVPQADVPMLAEYQVLPDERIVFVRGNDEENFRAMWDDVQALSPDALTRDFIEQFEIYENKEDDTLAFVDDVDGNSKWRIGINMAQYGESSIREQKMTLIHELAHILSLNATQIAQENTCGTLVLDEGCAREDSYIFAFWKKFWESNPKQTFKEQSFVSEYAATNEVEDFAESFAFFVIEKDKDMLGGSVRDQKVTSFYQFESLVQIRKDMRNVLERDIVRARKAESAPVE